MGTSRLSWCEISKPALINNIREFRRIAPPPVLLYPVVKANAYGHGIVLVSKVLKEEGVDGLCVNELWEVEQLRNAGIELPIVVLGWIPPEFANEIVQLNPIVVIYDRNVALAISKAASRVKKTIKVLIKVETGTNRQGLDEEEALELGRLITSLEGLEFYGLSTHFADIEDTTDHTYAMQQLMNFLHTAEAFFDAGMRPGVLSAANSAATILWPNTHLNLVRVGISLYGMWPSKETFATAVQIHREKIHLESVLTWKTTIAQVKTVPAGAYVGYGRTFRTTHPTKLAVIPVGYYDGYDRKGSNFAHVIINGMRAQIRGRVCMNMFMVDVTDIKGVKPGDEVILLGSQGDERITAEDLAMWFNTINYEVTTRINENIPRILVGGDG